MSGDEIYRNFVDAPGGENLAGAAAEIRQLVGEYEEQSREIIRLTERMESAWQGDSAGAAQRGAGPLAVAHAYAAPRIDTAQDLSARQVGSFGDARSAVRPVPPAPIRPDPWSMILSPDTAITYAGQVAAFNSASQHNVDVMIGYENASIFNTVGQPTFYGSLATDNADVVLDSTRSASSPPLPDPARSRQPTTGGHSLPTGDHEQEPQQATNPSRYQPPPAADRGLTGHPGADPRWTDPAGTTTSTPTGGARSETARLETAQSETGRPAITRPEAIRPDTARATTARPAAAPSAIARPDGSRHDGGKSTGNRATSGQFGPISKERATGGGIPLGAAGSGKTRAGEDEEHQRASFLREPDPEETFGTDERSTPPVIE